MRRPVAAVAAIVAVAMSSAPTATARTFSPPFTSAEEFVTGLRTCGGPGPVGMLFDGSNFFVTDYCNGTTYRMSPKGGDARGPNVTAVTNGLTHGLTLSHGRYYGAGKGNAALARGVYAFGPGTLDIGHKVFASTGEPRGVVGDPRSNDLYVSTSDGLYRVRDPESASPASTKVATGEFDGLAFTADGSRLYVTDFNGGRVVGFDRTFQKVSDVVVGHGADGLAVARAGAKVAGQPVAGNVFVNANDGSILRIDTQHGDAVSVVSSGGTRGDFVTVGPDGCLYATQSAAIERLQPCFFEPTVPEKGHGRGWLLLALIAVLVLVAIGLLTTLVQRR
jgi:DNA-binding beta-propeller fold protein YncE